jgi:serine/threonine protein kinase
MYVRMLKLYTYFYIGKEDKDRAIDLAVQEMHPDFDAHVFDDVSRDLVRRLLRKDPRKRLGARGAGEILAHPFFDTININELNTMQPPMHPPHDLNMATQSQIGDFANDASISRMQLSADDYKHYEGWAYSSQRAFEEEIVEFLENEDMYGSTFANGVGQTTCCFVS